MRQEELTKALIKASSDYYNFGRSSMSDHEFDKAIEELKELERTSGIVLPGSPTQNVGAVVTGLKKVRHEMPALSLDKVKYKDREDLLKWLSDKQAIMSWKMDGSTVVVTYDGGKLTSAVTRGNGEEGSDITHNARFFKGIPESISYTGHLVLRGEAFMENAEFERINAETGGEYENARNLATATIQMLDANESKKRRISFKAFELVSPEPELKFKLAPQGLSLYNLRYMQDRLLFMSSLGFDVVEFETADSTDILQKVEEWKEDLVNLKYPTDGLVFSYQDLKKGWALGSTGHHPRWAIALKWTDETVTTTIRDIEWSVGKTGAITPVAIFDPVRLGLGSTVTRASLHNLTIMKNMPVTGKSGEYQPIMIGSKAEVYLANLIIPQVASVSGGDIEIEVPDICPACGEPVEVAKEHSTEVLQCLNKNCPARTMGELMNTFGKDGLFIKGLGESQIKDLISFGLVQTAVDFYTLEDRVNSDTRAFGQYSRLMQQDGWGKKKWENLIEAINVSRNTTLQKFLYSLNIPLLGNDLSKKLSAFFNHDINAWTKFMEMADIDLLMLNDGIGEEKAKAIIDWCDEISRDPLKKLTFDSLVKELSFAEFKITSTDRSLEGMTFVITGAVHDYKNRDEFKASVEARGGKVAGSVSAKTNFLVNNDVTSTSGKNKKAKELGIEIISEDDFINRFGR